MALSIFLSNNKDFIISLRRFIQDHLSDIFRDACAVMLAGSVSLGFIENPRDVDLSIILSPSLSDVGPFGAGYINKAHKQFYRLDGYAVTIDFHYRRLALDDYKYYTNAWMFHFNQLLWVRDDVDFGLLQDQGDPSLEFLRRNLTTLIPSCLRFLAAEKEGRAPRKQLYYIYGMTCVLAHQTFDFTDEEKKTLNLLHDGGGNRAAIVEWCETTLGLFQAFFIFDFLLLFPYTNYIMR